MVGTGTNEGVIIDKVGSQVTGNIRGFSAPGEYISEVDNANTNTVNFTNNGVVDIFEASGAGVAGIIWCSGEWGSDGEWKHGTPSN